MPAARCRLPQLGPPRRRRRPPPRTRARGGHTKGTARRAGRWRGPGPGTRWPDRYARRAPAFVCLALRPPPRSPTDRGALTLLVTRVSSGLICSPAPSASMARWPPRGGRYGAAPRGPPAAAAAAETRSREGKRACVRARGTGARGGAGHAGRGARVCARRPRGWLSQGSEAAVWNVEARTERAGERGGGGGGSRVGARGGAAGHDARGARPPPRHAPRHASSHHAPCQFGTASLLSAPAGPAAGPAGGGAGGRRDGHLSQPIGGSRSPSRTPPQPPLQEAPPLFVKSRGS
nr:uncharacterized protein LOC111768402 [Equus caballus]